MNLYQHVNENGRPTGKTRKIFEKIKEDAFLYGNDETFNPTLALVVTYNKLHQFPYVSNTYPILTR